MAPEVTVVTTKAGGYALQVKKGDQQTELPLEGCKSKEEAETIKTALLTEINKAEVQKATKPQGVGAKVDKAA